MRVESAGRGAEDRRGGISIRLLGTVTVVCNGNAVALPTSRKLCALLAYLALAPHPLSRSRLCDLLWDAPNDPRGELRWCLSKLRSIFDERERQRIKTSGDMIALQLSEASVDAIEVETAVAAGIERLDVHRLRSLSELFTGDFLEGLEISRCPHFNSWLTARRRRFRSVHIAILEQLATRSPASSGVSEDWLARWLEMAPFDVRAHAALLTHLMSNGRTRECEEHLSSAARTFADEDLDFKPVREMWQTLRSDHRQDVMHASGAAPTERTPATPAEPTRPADPSPRRAALAVMPFKETREGTNRGGIADGLTHDIIARLAKLRNIFIIARGSVFALADGKIGPEEAGRRLKVDYVASGTVRLDDARAIVSVEVVEVRTARIVWADVFEHRLDDTFSALDDIGDSIVSAIASEIEAAEKARAILKAPNSLNAWEAYHRGLWHMYRFTKLDNERAQHFFRRSLQLDPTFARAHAGMSFTHWQSAFQKWEDRGRQTGLALHTAGQSLLADDQNPAAHWAMGRALWLQGDQDEALRELEQAVELSPNFALGHYTLAFVNSQSGDPKLAIGSSNHSRHLSPFDPLLFGMLAARGLAHVRLQEFDEAVDWALRAVARPNAHVHIVAVAAHCLGLAGRLEEGRAHVASIRKTHPRYTTDDFLDAFRFSPDAAALFREAGKRVGLG